MSISERLFEILDRKGIKPAEFARKINTTPQAIKNWKDRGTTPPMEFLPAICKVLGISWEYLVTGEPNKHDFELLPDEEQLLRVYRKADDKGKARIHEYAREMTALYPFLTKDLEQIVETLQKKPNQRLKELDEQ